MNKRFRNGLLVSVLAIGVFHAVQSSAAVVKIAGASVRQILIADGGRWGGCMVLLSKSVNDVLPNCAGSYVTFSCSGVHTDKDIAYRMLDQAQMAYALGRNVNVYVDDSKTHNGYCYANRIDSN